MISVPSLFYQRLLHQSHKAQKAVATLNKAGDSGLLSWKIVYPEHRRSLEIFFEPDFPYSIRGWEERYPDGFGENAKELVTRGTHIKTLQSDYWNHHQNADTILRKELGLGAGPRLN